MLYARYMRLTGQNPSFRDYFNIKTHSQLAQFRSRTHPALTVHLAPRHCSLFTDLPNRGSLIMLFNQHAYTTTLIILLHLNHQNRCRSWVNLRLQIKYVSFPPWAIGEEDYDLQFAEKRHSRCWVQEIWESNGHQWRPQIKITLLTLIFLAGSTRSHAGKSSHHHRWGRLYL